MSRRRPLALLACDILVAVPSSALAQSAGDDQYSDPLGSNPSADSGNSGSGSKQPSQSQSPAPPAAPSSSGTSGTTGSGTSSGGSKGSGSRATASGRHELPRTGGEPGLIAALGAGLLLTGAGVRLTLTPGPRAARRAGLPR